MSIDSWGVLLLVCVALWIGIRIGKTDAEIEAARRRHPSSQRPPRRPEGVRILHRDGTETLCEPAYRGLDVDGSHVWEIATPFNTLAGDRLHVDMMPGHTALTFPTNDFHATGDTQEDPS